MTHSATYQVLLWYNDIFFFACFKSLTAFCRGCFSSWYRVECIASYGLSLTF